MPYLDSEINYLKNHISNLHAVLDILNPILDLSSERPEHISIEIGYSDGVSKTVTLNPDDLDTYLILKCAHDTTQTRIEQLERTLKELEQRAGILS